MKIMTYVKLNESSIMNSIPNSDENNLGVRGVFDQVIVDTSWFEGIYQVDHHFACVCLGVFYICIEEKCSSIISDYCMNVRMVRCVIKSTFLCQNASDKH